MRDLALPVALGATAVAYRLTCPLARDDALCARLVSSAVLCAVCTGLVLHVRHRMLRELRQVRRVAEAAQSALLRTPPPHVDGLAVAAVQLPADRGARIGGDLYEVVATEHGVRAVIGDVRGHGLGAVGTVAAVLGSFREAVHDEAELAGVLRRLERAVARHLRERAGDEHAPAGTADAPVCEEFVTVLVLEILPDGEVRALNCGHPWPYLLSGARADSLARADPLPPLGPFPLPPELPVVACGRLLPGDALVLHTDGAEEARDADGRFFPLREVLTDAAGEHPVAPRTVLRTVLGALLRHTVGPPEDDVALLIIGNERPPRRAPAGVRGAARPAAADPPPTDQLQFPA
ncbi:protein phosphatase [Streptomyces sp. NWU49]|uniref:PP2C family protein-serine/threonine phosphatase n=1 Tax=Streptomyces sp. NWU49 TaxID=2201153 RepID=UPI000D67291E|nr:PP2C family protein-serine/threonine phosphatase [Streptomyces sp. NWU49]PWJ07321.1 protein phosphatase [Streptomyces sp. NWU49]